MEAALAHAATTDPPQGAGEPLRGGGLTGRKKDHTIRKSRIKSMSRVTIYIPDATHFLLLKEQRRTGLSFSSLCQNAFDIYFAQNKKEQEPQNDLNE